MNKRPGSKGHVSNEDIAAFLDEGLSAKKEQAVAAHLAMCGDCLKVFITVILSQLEIQHSEKPSS